MQFSAYSQLWRGFGPPGTSLRDTACTWGILLLCGSIELTVAEKLSKNIEVCLVLDPRPVSSAVTWFTYRQLPIWINIASIRIIKVRCAEFWIPIVETAEKEPKKIGLGANGKQANTCGEQKLSWTSIYLYYRMLTSEIEKKKKKGKKLKICKHIVWVMYL